MISTACFFTYSGPGRISIARSAPRNITAGYRVYRPLQPGLWFRSVSWAEYEVLYAEQLNALNPHKVIDDLYRLAAHYDPVLLCWERVDQGERCHRQLVAEWLRKEASIEVGEYDPRALALNPGSV